MKASAASMSRSFSAVMASPYWKREDRHAKEGLSQVGSPSSRESARISAFHIPASMRGALTPAALAASMPGRWSPRSSMLAPYTMIASPCCRAIGPSLAKSSSLQKKQRLGEFSAYRGLSSSWVWTTRSRMQSRSASRRVSSSSEAGYVSESAVTSTAPLPTASLAARPRKVESTPPEKATRTCPMSRMIPRSPSCFAASAASTLPFQADHLGKGQQPLFDLPPLQPLEPLQREVLHGEGGHGGAPDHRPPERGRVRGVLLSEVTHEAAGEGIPRPRRVEHRLEGVGRREEELASRDQQGAVLAALDHHGPRAHLADGPRRLDQVGLARQHPGLGVVDEQHVHSRQHAEEVRALALDPEVHGVERGQRRPLHLLEDLELEHGVDIREEQEARLAVARSQLGLECRESIELHVERPRFVERSEDNTSEP